MQIGLVWQGLPIPKATVETKYQMGAIERGFFFFFSSFGLPCVAWDQQ
jgi:hypothetical protein